MFLATLVLVSLSSIQVVQAWSLLPPQAKRPPCPSVDTVQDPNEEHRSIRHTVPGGAPTSIAMLLPTALMAGAVTVAATGTPPLPVHAAITNDVVSRGQQVFDANCAACHLGGANFVNESRTLQQEALTRFGVGVSPSSIETFLTQDSQRHKRMAFFRAEGGKLTPEQWTDVAAFVADQAQGNKW